MSRADRFEFTLDEETEKRLYDLLTDLDTRKISCFWIKDKRGYYAEYVKVIRCKDCKHFTGKWCILNSRKEFDPEDRLVNGEGFCAWAERKEE